MHVIALDNCFAEAVLPERDVCDDSDYNSEDYGSNDIPVGYVDLLCFSPGDRLKEVDECDDQADAK